MDRVNLITTRLLNGRGKKSTLLVEINSNSLNGQVFDELNKVLDRVEMCQNAADVEDRIDGVVFASAKSKIFLAGADLFQLDKILSAEDSHMRDRMLEEVINRGQDTFARIEKLKVPTLAAINGACLGGGYELALACDYRIASNDKSTKIGLPEVTLGILPAWGGSTRLPELIGIPNALNVILTGKQYAAKPAKKLGLIDEVVHKENLITKAVEIVREKKRPENRRGWMHYALPVSVVTSKARSTVTSKTKGNYPAPLRIIDVIKKSNSIPRASSFALEKKIFIELCNTPHMRNLLRIFFLQEKSKRLVVSNTSIQKPIRDAVVVGAGTMGAGIAQWLSSRGLNVTLKDVDDKSVCNGLKKIGKLYVDGVRGYKFDRPTARSGLSRVTAATTDIPLRNKDIVIEAIVEKLDVKQKVLAQLEEELPDDAIIATNTSALSIDEMASCLKRPERFVGIHFFNPVHKMKLVEVVKGTKTSEHAVQRAVKFVQSIGKLPVVVKDNPGFVVNRILVPYLVKAAEMYSEGAQVEAVDSAMIKFGMPMGPFRLMDEIGLDVCYHVANDLKNRLDLHYSLEELEWRVDCDRLGKKSGEGFYKYKKGKSIKNKIKKTVDPQPLIDAMTKEAQAVLDEGVIDDPDMLDFAMIMGTGWAPFRGGPVKYTSHV